MDIQERLSFGVGCTGLLLTTSLGVDQDLGSLSFETKASRLSCTLFWGVDLKCVRSFR